MNNEYTFKKIAFSEFDKLNHLFDDTEEKWLKYRAGRLEQFEKNDIDVYVIEHKNAFIGEVSANYSCHGLPNEAIPNVRAYFEAFRLEKEYQGRGLGQKLMNYALDDLKSRGYTEFTIGVEDDNEIAKHIYFKLGFTEEINFGHGNEFDPCEYRLYLKKGN